MQGDYHYKTRPDYGDLYEDEEDTAPGKGGRRLAALLVALILAAAAYWWWSSQPTRDLDALSEVATVELPLVETPATHPLPATPGGRSEEGAEVAQSRNFGPVPNLDGSDPVIQGVLQQLVGDIDLSAYLVPRNLIRKFVVTVDNLPGKRIPQQYLPVQRPPGGFRVREEQDDIVMDISNYARYSPFVNILTAMNSRDIVALYVHFYPLFQSAYEELGYPGQYFNDRMITAIDDLLATPEVRDPIPLVQPGIYYHYADPKLEALSAGQKLLLRMGPDNAAKVKQVLRRVRGQITTSE